MDANKITPYFERGSMAAKAFLQRLLFFAKAFLPFLLGVVATQPCFHDQSRAKFYMPTHAHAAMRPQSKNFEIYTPEKNPKIESTYLK